MSRPDGLLFRLVTGQALPASQPIPVVDPNAPMAVEPWVAHSQGPAPIPVVVPAPGLPPMMIAHQPTQPAQPLQPSPPAPSLMDAAIREAQGRIIAASRPSPPAGALNAAIAPLTPDQLGRVLSAGGQFLFGPEEQQPVVAGLTPSEPTIQALSPLQRLQGLGMNYEPVRRAQSVLETLLPVAEFGLGGPENAAMGGGALHAAAPLAGAGEEGKGLIQALAPEAAPWAKYANEFPPVAEPVLAQDIKKGKVVKEWYERGSTPETEELADIRRGVRNQLAEQGVQTSKNPSGWKPFFDPEKRFYADPSSYPTPEDIQASMPKTQRTIDMYRAKVQTPENIARARQDLELGRTLVDPKTGLPAGDLWYALGQLQKGLVDEMGPKAGHERFMHITDALAATTSGANPETNLVSTMYGLFLKNHGLPIPTGPNPAGEIATRSYAMPIPTSGERLSGNMDVFDRVINKGEELSMENPKRLSFSSNLRGHRNMATIDQQIVQGVTPDFQSGDVFQRGQWGKVNKKTGKFTPGEISHPNAPPGDSYFAYDELIRNLAKEHGMDPLNAQALIWVGKKYRETGEISVPMIQEVNNMIERTSRLTGRSPEEVFKKGFAYKNPRSAIPLYGFLGAAGAGAAARAARGQKQGP